MLEPPLPYVRPLFLGSRGTAVEASKRGVYKLLNNPVKWRGFIDQATVSKRFFGPFFRRDLILAQHEMTVGKAGVVDEPTLRGLEQYMDAKARSLWLQQFPPKSKPTPLVEPKQGFVSLTRDLYEAYSIGRGMGLTDLGTYNPSSKLPSGAPSDHATSRLDGRIGEPACAFDLGFTPQTGMSNPTASKFFQLMVGRPEVNYVICGTSIWSVTRGLHAYTNGGHEGHVHTSGHRR